jgi:hypothetical protein
MDGAVIHGTAMASGDDIGGRGEAIFSVLITDFCGRSRPYFRPHFLGEKFPTLDFQVELLGAGARPPYFFVQVKTTRQGYTTKGPRRLKIKVSQRDVRRMAAYPAPTYVVGIDEVGVAGYIACVRAGMASAISGLPARHPLDAGNLKRLWVEVKDYWEQRDMTQKASVFSI